jgi:hypothetical protein
MAYADGLYSEAVGFLTDIGINEQDIIRYRDEQTAEAVRAFMQGN